MSYNQNMQHNFLSKYPKVQNDSSDWTKIEYLLQLSLGSISAQVTNIWTIANPSLTNAFQKRTNNLLVLDSWLDISQMDENVRIEKVCQKGFDFQNKGIEFHTGHLQLSETQVNKNKEYEVLLLKIAVGKSYCLPAKSVVKDSSKLAYGFDSIYFYDEDEDNQEGIFKHKYMLFDNNQVLPMYIVQFKFDQNKEDQQNQPLCEGCEQMKANVYCYAEDAVLCYDCNEEHHQGGKLLSKHQRVPLSEKPKSFGICPQHQDAKLELYCIYCNTPLCVYCKITGTHSGGAAAGHTLVKITDAYQKALADSKELDPLLEKRKNQLAELLSQIDQRIKDINKNASIIEETIYKILQNALIQLQEETQKKMSFLIADQLELKRQYDHIQWLESFLKYQQDQLNPADYLNAWARHSDFRKEILSLSTIPILTKVQPDMRIVENKITITTDQIHKAYEDDHNLSPEKQQFLDRSINQAQNQEQQELQQSGLISNIFGKHQYVDKDQRMFKNVINSQEQNKQVSVRSEYTNDINLQEQKQVRMLTGQQTFKSPKTNINEVDEREEGDD